MLTNYSIEVSVEMMNEPCDRFLEPTLVEKIRAKLRKVFEPEPKPLDISDEGIVI